MSCHKSPASDSVYSTHSTAPVGMLAMRPFNRDQILAKIACIISYLLYLSGWVGIMSRTYWVILGSGDSMNHNHI